MQIGFRDSEGGGLYGVRVADCMVSKKCLADSMVSRKCLGTAYVRHGELYGVEEVFAYSRMLGIQFAYFSCCVPVQGTSRLLLDPRQWRTPLL